MRDPIFIGRFVTETRPEDDQRVIHVQLMAPRFADAMLLAEAVVRAMNNSSLTDDYWVFSVIEPRPFVIGLGDDMFSAARKVLTI